MTLPTSGTARSRPGLASAFAATGVLVAVLVFVGLPTRYAPVDAPAALVVALFGVAAVGLGAGRPWGVVAAQVAAWLALGCGLALVTLLLLAASFLSGVYGFLGKGGSIVALAVVALVVPYLVALPAIALVLLRPRRP